MLTVKDAESKIYKKIENFGTEKADLQEAFGRVLAKPVYADRDFPPFDRSTMDGIAINYASFSNGQRSFFIKQVLAAGQEPLRFIEPDQCVEIMTGAPLPGLADTVIPIEDVSVKGKFATVRVSSVKKGQFIHPKGADRKKGQVVLKSGSIISDTIIPILASVGALQVDVVKLPQVLIITTGNEVVEPELNPTEYKIRRSNDLMMSSALRYWGISPKIFHAQDDEKEMIKILEKNISNFDVILLCGGVSKGKFDYVGNVLKKVGVVKVFHDILQKPGRPMWFGEYGSGTKVFAFPGNPVSVCVCLYRYFLPWLKKSLKVNQEDNIYAVLDRGVEGLGDMTRFIQVGLHFRKNGEIFAEPIMNNGSGDFLSLAYADAFAEINPGKSRYRKGDVVRIWQLNKPLV